MTMTLLTQRETAITHNTISTGDDLRNFELLRRGHLKEKHAVYLGMEKKLDEHVPSVLYLVYCNRDSLSATHTAQPGARRQVHGKISPAESQSRAREKKNEREFLLGKSTSLLTYVALFHRAGV